MDYLFALQSIREACPDFINVFFIIISEYCVLLSFIIPAVIYWCIDKTGGATILFGYCVAFDLNQTIKNCACVYRPWVLDSRLHIDSHAVKSATGYSFPSGHTTTAASIYGGISVWQKKRTWVVVLMSLMIVLTAFARNWLGAHTLKDVVCAILFVAVWLILVNLIKCWVYKKAGRDTILCFGGIALALAVLIIMSVKNYPVDYTADGTILVDPYAMLTDCYSAFGSLAASLLGWWLERRIINYNTDFTKKKKWIISISGVIICLLIYVAGSAVFAFAGAHISHLLKYFIIFFYIFFIHPLLFTKVFVKKDK